MKAGGPCNHCKRTESPLWRKGPEEKPVLCNACGARWLVKRNLEGYVPGAPLVPTNKGQRSRGSAERRHKKSGGGDRPPRSGGGAAGELAGLLENGETITGGKRQRRPNARYQRALSPEGGSGMSGMLKKARSEPNLQAPHFYDGGFGIPTLPSHSAGSVQMGGYGGYRGGGVMGVQGMQYVQMSQAQLEARRRSAVSASHAGFDGFVRGMPMSDGMPMSYAQMPAHQPQYVGMVAAHPVDFASADAVTTLPEGAVPYDDWMATYNRLANTGMLDPSAHPGIRDGTRDAYARLVSMRGGTFVDPNIFQDPTVSQAQYWQPQHGHQQPPPQGAHQPPPPQLQLRQQMQQQMPLQTPQQQQGLGREPARMEVKAEGPLVAEPAAADSMLNSTGPGIADPMLFPTRGYADGSENGSNGSGGGGHGRSGSGSGGTGSPSCGFASSFDDPLLIDTLQNDPLFLASGAGSW